MQRSIIWSSLNNARTFKVVGTWYKPHFNHEGHVEGHVYTVVLKSKLTVNCISNLETRFSNLETFEDGVSRIESRVSMIEDRGSSFKFRVEEYELVVRARTNQCSP